MYRDFLKRTCVIERGRRNEEPFKRRDKIKSGNEYEISVALTGIAI